MARAREEKMTSAEKASMLAETQAASQGSSIPLEIVPEPRSWQFPEQFAQSTTHENNILAVYGSAASIAALDAQNLLTSAHSDRMPRGNANGLHKAYIIKEVADAYLQKHGVQAATKPLLPLMKDDKEIHALGICHTDAPVTGDASETISYLVLAARDAMDFDQILKRFGTNPAQYQITNGFGRHESMLVMPVLRSMANAVQAASPQAISLDGGALKDAAPRRETIRALLDMAEQHPAFQRAVPQPTISEIVDATLPKEQKPTRPLSDYVSEIRPSITRIVRHEKLNGANEDIMHCVGSRQLHDTIQKMASVQCATPVTINGQGSHYSLKAAYTQVNPLLADVPHETTYQTISPSMLGDRKVIVGTRMERGKQKMNVKEYPIDDLQIGTIGEGDTTQYWLIMRSQHPTRAKNLAKDLGYADSALHPLTDLTEVPALVAVRLGRQNDGTTGAALAEHLLANEELELASPTAYASFEEMKRTQRESVDMMRMVGKEAPKRSADKTPTRVKPPVKEIEAIRQAAAQDFFAKDIRRCWITIAPPSARNVEDVAAHECIALGISVPNKKARQFSESMAAQVRRIPGWVWTSIGTFGENDKKRALFVLKMPKTDAESFADRSSEDMERPRPENEFMVEADVHRLIRAELGVTTTAATKKVAHDAEAEGWAHLAKLVEAEEIDVCDVRYDHTSMTRDATELRNQVSAVQNWIRKDAVARELQSRHRDSPVNAGSGLVRSSMDRMFGLFGEYVASVSTRKAKSRQPIEKAGTESLLAIQQYQHWLKKAQDANGQAVLSHLVVKNPSAETLGALAKLAKISVRNKAGKKMPLFPIEPSIYYVGDNTKIYTYPVSAEFFDMMKQHGAALTHTNLPVIESADFNRHIREDYGPKPIDDKVVALKPQQLRRDARNRVLEEMKKSSIRNAALYVELKDEHNFEYEELRQENGYEEKGERNRIGLQPAVIINIASARDWSSKLSPFVDALQDSGLWVPRQYFAHTPTVEEMEQLQLNIEQRGQAYRELGKLYYELAKCMGGNEQGDTKGLLTEATSIQQACLSREFPDIRIHPMVDAIVSNNGQLSPAQGEVLMRAIKQFRMDMRAEEQRLQSVYDATQVEREQAFEQSAQGIKRTDPVPLCYVNGDREGHTAAEMNDIVHEHFLNSTEPLRAVLHLNKKKFRGEDKDKDKELAAAFSNAPKTAQGRWSEKFTPPATSNITMVQAFADADKHFNARQLG